MENEKQYSKADGWDQGKKIKTNFARIIVGGKAEKPYYDILYFDPADGKYHIGFGSYYLEYVFKWLSEEFEIVENTVSDLVNVVRCRECAKNGLSTCPICFIESRTLRFINHDPDFYCGSGERKSDE